MKITKKIILMFLIFSLSIINFFTLSYGKSVPITKENLTQSLEGLKSNYDSEDTNYNINITDTTIEITLNDNHVILNYDLTDKPTFSVSVPISQGIKYEDFDLSNLFSLIIPYIAVANIQEVSYDNASTYVAGITFEVLFSQLLSSKYIVIDDTDPSYVPSDIISGENIIYASQFGEHVMEYVNDLFENPVNYSDSNYLNTYSWTIEQKDLTETSCNLVSTLTIDTNADFSKIAELVDPSEQNPDPENPDTQNPGSENPDTQNPDVQNPTIDIPNTTPKDDLTQDLVDNLETQLPVNESLNNSNNTSTPTTTTTTTNNNKKLPQTGNEFNIANILYGIALFAILGIIILYAYSKKLDKNK